MHIICYVGKLKIEFNPIITDYIIITSMYPYVYQYSHILFQKIDSHYNSMRVNTG